MADYFEIDFLDVESPKSGDAIAIRYEKNNSVHIHVVDGGYLETGKVLADHIRKHYGNPLFIDNVVVTHPDGDHAAGVRTILEEFLVGTLWMLRPWNYADELIARFPNFSSVENLKNRLKEIYPHIAELEKMAIDRGILILEPFQNARIGDFVVMAPTYTRYLELIVASEKTPETGTEDSTWAFSVLGAKVMKAAAKVIAFVKAEWGAEIFSPDETSAENEMSVVQYAELCGIRVLLTADTGRGGLTEAANFAPSIGLKLPGIKKFQVPHHGARRNVSTETLDQWLGPRLPMQLPEGQQKFEAIVSSAKADTDHPRRSVVRAMIHRGAKVLTTEGLSLRVPGGQAPVRQGWVPAIPQPYPADQEE